MMKAGFKLYGGEQNHQIPPLASIIAVLAIYSVQSGLERKTWKIIRQKDLSVICVSLIPQNQQAYG